MKKQVQLLLGIAAVLIAPAFSPAATINWNVTSGDLGTSTNWSPNTDITSTGNTWIIANGGTATVTTGENYTLNSAFNVGDSTGSGTLTMTGNGTLTVSGGNMSIGNNNSANAGTVVLSGTSKLTTGTLYLGHRTTGTLTVNTGTQVTSTNLFIGDGSASANGTLNLYGTMNLTGATGNVKFGGTSSTAASQGIINTYAGSSLIAAGSLGTTNGLGTFAINLNGSGSTFSFAKAITANSSSTTFSFLADSGGITTVTSGADINISGAVLKLNIDAYTGINDLVLFSGTSITGTFSSVVWSGTQQATLIYGSDKIYLDVVPEPSSVAYLGFSLLSIAAMTAVARRRSA